MKRKIVYFASTTIGIVAMFFLFAPEERVNTVVEGTRQLTNPKAQACLDYERNSLKDPDSARLISVKPTESGVEINFKAKNGYGAYGTMRGICNFSDGKVDKVMSQAAIEILVLDEQLKCMELRRKARELGTVQAGPSEYDCERTASYERVRNSPR